jgi:hypothetical protein
MRKTTQDPFERASGEDVRGASLNGRDFVDTSWFGDVDSDIEYGGLVSSSGRRVCDIFAD